MYTHIYTHVYTYTYVCVCIHIYIYIYMIGTSVHINSTHVARRYDYIILSPSLSSTAILTFIHIHQLFRIRYALF